MSVPFVLGGTSHLVAIGLTLGVPFLLALARQPTAKIAARIFFATFLIGTEILWQSLLVERGWGSAETVLPLQLCDWAMAAAIVTLIWPNRWSYELAYFWAFCGSLQALITPDLAVDFPDLRFIVFFAQHGGVIAAVLYMTVGMGMRPVPGSIPTAIVGTFVYLGVAGAADWLLGTNFGFLAAKPQHASLLDLLAPWPFYIVELVPIGLLLIAAFYAPFFVADRLRTPAVAPSRQT